MKLAIVSPDKQNRIDGTLLATILSHLPTGSLHEASAVIVPISYFPDFAFNGLAGLDGRKVVVVDFIEYGWQWDGCHILGRGYGDCGMVSGQEWAAFDAWLRDNPPVLYLKRELTRDGVTDAILPIDFACTVSAPPLQSKEEYAARPLDVFHSWGYSHPARPKLHADIFLGMANAGLSVIGHWSEFDAAVAHTAFDRWMTVHSPYYSRIPIQEVMRYQWQSRMAVGLFGCGRKCFRDGESFVGTVPVFADGNMAFSHPWVHGVNCLMVDADTAYGDLLHHVGRKDLHAIYLAAQENGDRYRVRRYVDEYVVPRILERL